MQCCLSSKHNLYGASQKIVWNNKLVGPCLTLDYIVHFICYIRYQSKTELKSLNSSGLFIKDSWYLKLYNSFFIKTLHVCYQVPYICNGWSNRTDCRKNSYIFISYVDLAYLACVTLTTRPRVQIHSFEPKHPTIISKIRITVTVP